MNNTIINDTLTNVSDTLVCSLTLSEPGVYILKGTIHGEGSAWGANAEMLCRFQNATSNLYHTSNSMLGARFCAMSSFVTVGNTPKTIDALGYQATGSDRKIRTCYVLALKIK